jgi:hypothetical protein
VHNPTKKENTPKSGETAPGQVAEMHYSNALKNRNQLTANVSVVSPQSCGVIASADIFIFSTTYLVTSSKSLPKESVIVFSCRKMPLTYYNSNLAQLEELIRKSPKTQSI